MQHHPYCLCRFYLGINLKVVPHQKFENSILKLPEKPHSDSPLPLYGALMRTHCDQMIVDRCFRYLHFPPNISNLGSASKKQSFHQSLFNCFSLVLADFISPLSLPAFPSSRCSPHPELCGSPCSFITCPSLDILRMVSTVFMYLLELKDRGWTGEGWWKRPGLWGGWR